MEQAMTDSRTDRRVVLDVQSIQATYGQTIRALNGVTLTVREGEILAVLGSNGAGKTTTMRSISNLLPAERGQVTSGTITFDGRDVLVRKPADLVRAGLVQVLEGRHCFKSLSVEENLISGGLGRGSGRADIAHDLERVFATFPRLRDKRYAAAGLISGGEQQMTAIGRALMSRPRLLVLDEPSMGLAPMVIQDIFSALKRLNRESGLAILVAEQNSTIALQYADSATVIENGRTVLSGTAAELRARDDIKAFYLGERSGLFTDRPAA
jgi:branched-chain amino acid transport system ATP-binding protein